MKGKRLLALSLTVGMIFSCTLPVVADELDENTTLVQEVNNDEEIKPASSEEQNFEDASEDTESNSEENDMQDAEENIESAITDEQESTDKSAENDNEQPVITEGENQSQNEQSTQLLEDEIEVNFEEEMTTFELDNPYNASASISNAPSIENGGWNDYPVVYSYNYDTSSMAQWGAWGGNGNLQGQKYEDTNNNDISNKIGVYTDGNVVKVYVSYASLFNGCGNGNDYNISVDGNNAKYRIVLEDGTDLTGARLEPGVYKLKIINGDGSISGTDAEGAYGTIIVKPNNCNNEMEFTVPIETMMAQNSNIDGNVGQVTFFSPNIAGKSVSCGGADTGAAGTGVIALLFGGIGAFLTKKPFVF